MTPDSAGVFLTIRLLVGSGLRARPMVLFNRGAGILPATRLFLLPLSRSYGSSEGVKRGSAERFSPLPRVWGCPPRFRKPGREPSPKAACDVADASRGLHTIPDPKNSVNP